MEEDCLQNHETYDSLGSNRDVAVGGPTEPSGLVILIDVCKKCISAAGFPLARPARNELPNSWRGSKEVDEGGAFMT